MILNNLYKSQMEHTSLSLAALQFFEEVFCFLVISLIALADGVFFFTLVPTSVLGNFSGL